MRYTIVLRNVGLSLMLVASLMLLSAIVAAFSGPDDSMLPLLFSASVTFVCGVYPLIFVKADKYVSVHESYFIVVFSWLASCVCGMIPYLCYGTEFSFADALFESVSGFTTTGASILKDIESLPRGLQFWRMSTAWVGGIGIVTLFSLLVPRKDDSRSVLPVAEISNIALAHTCSHGKSVVRMMLSVYISLTLLCSVGLRVCGLDWFEAVTTAMSTCSTCGFCMLNDSIAGFHNPVAEYVIILFMLLSGISFIRLYSSVVRDRNRVRKNDASTVYLSIIAIGIIVIFADLLMNKGGDSVAATFRTAAFQFSSIITTTGFATADTSIWPSISIITLALASIVCGCSGSTSGGMKMDRLLLLAKACYREVVQVRMPGIVRSIRVDGQIVKDAAISRAISFVLLYFLFILTGFIINIAGGLDFITGLSASVACIGNVGPGFGSVGSFGNYADLPVLLKYNSMALMFLGRLEILPVLSVFFLSLKK